MAKSKLRVTPFARFFFVMLFLAPLAYIGASYYNGEDGIQNIKNIFSGSSSADSASDDEYTPTSSDLSDSDLASQNAELKRKLKEKDREIEELKEQLEKIKSALGN